MNSRTASRLALFLALVLLPVCGGSGQDDFDREWLEKAEDLSESLANDLLTLSVAVRDGNFGAAKSFFADPLEATPLPESPPRLEPLAK